MIPIIRWELSTRRAYLLWWCIGITALIIILMAVYPSIRSQAAQLNTAFKHLPASARALRGGGDLTTPAGYLNAELFYITLPLLLIIMAVSLGGSILARDEQDHTLELLLARPVSRGRVLAAKAISSLALIGSVGALATVVTVVAAKLVNMDIAARHIVLTSVLTTIFAAAFGALTFAFSAASLFSRKLGLAVAVVASFGGYLLESLSGLSDYIKTPAQFLPYHYFVPKDLLTGNVSRSLLLYMAGIFAACAIVAYLGFRRRDLN